MNLEIYILDLIGVFAFSVYGTYFWLKHNLDLFWIWVSAFLTAVWWGILRDIILNKTPLVFKYDLYATIAILLGIVYWIFIDKMDNFFYVNLLIISFLFVRFYVIYKKLNLWKFNKNYEKIK